MQNIKKSVPYKTSDKSWYYEHCLQETYKIFPYISQVIISHDIVLNRNAAPLSFASPWWDAFFSIIQSAWSNSVTVDELSGNASRSNGKLNKRFSRRI